MIDWALGTFLATSALIILVLLLREPVRQRFGARVAYALWLIPAARLLMPTITTTIERPVIETSPIQPFVPEVLAEPRLLAAVAAEPGLIEQLGGWTTIVLTVWFGVSLGLFLRGLWSFHRQRAVILDRSTERARIGSIRLVSSADVSGPLAFGIADRVIAVPVDFDQRFGEREQHLALAHEISHHRSGDLIANFFAFVLLCLQWFNPLAWVAHAAFRFDQEAACDARVLDKASADDRAAYGRAIAKAASGRALLFAAALDHRNTLKRRLHSMLTHPTAGRRLAGRLMVLVGVAVALPLTATRAVEYVDIAARTAPKALDSPVATVAPVAAAASVSAAAPVAPVAAVAAVEASRPLNIEDGTIMMDGKRRKFSELTPAEKAEVRRSIAEARQSLSRVQIDRAQIERDVREAIRGAQLDKAELRRDLARSRAEVARAMAEIDRNSTEIRRGGQDPEQIKATVRAAMRSVEAIDVERITREALASLDEKQIAAGIAAAEQGVRSAEAELDRIEALSQDD
jgi:beta-lactamase regulating signal transducer with metallopeptidase domain